MGQKVNPTVMRLGITSSWGSRWFAGKTHAYAKKVNEDRRIRDYIFKKYREAGIARIEIERSNKMTYLSLYSSRPGVIIGRQGAHIDELKKDLHKRFQTKFEVAIKEVKNPYQEAKLVGEDVAQQLERRISFRRACKMAVQKAIEGGAKGIKVQVSGRLGGAEIARSEFFLEGKIPLHTFRADISYAEVRAQTTYGVIGIKVWVYRGEVFKKQSSSEEE